MYLTDKFLGTESFATMFLNSGFQFLTIKLSGIIPVFKFTNLSLRLSKFTY